jgi:non-haem Fe2+, alpha-ketoglutarate-dependent halogenase
MLKAVRQFGVVILHYIRAAWVTFVYSYRKMGLPRGLLFIKELRQIYDYWSDDMMVTFIKSGGVTLPMDQPCQMRTPAVCRPRAKAAQDEYTMSKEDIKAFYRDGFVEPFRVWDEHEMKEFGDRLLEHRQNPSTIYGTITDRDRHLEYPEMLRMMCHPAIVDRLTQLLGPDIKIWRSHIFHKPPGGKAIQWHQASTYLFENKFTEPVVLPLNIDALFQLTVWIAVDRVNLANGCLKIVPGTNKRIENLRLEGDTGFQDALFVLDYDVDDSQVRDLIMEPGEVLIFSERTIHGSEANTSDMNRLAFNFRCARGDAAIYPVGKTHHYAAQLNESFDLAKWREVVLRGQDCSGRGRDVDWQELLAELDQNNASDSKQLEPQMKQSSANRGC